MFVGEYSRSPVERSIYVLDRKIETKTISYYSESWQKKF
jgi:hypothetical protein